MKAVGGGLFPRRGRYDDVPFRGAVRASGGGCSYFAPIKQFAITPGFVYEYDVYLIIGRVDEIRAAAYRLQGKG